MTIQESLCSQTINERTLEIAKGFGAVASVKYRDSLGLMYLSEPKMPDVAPIRLADGQSVLPAMAIEIASEEGQS
jgi:hypothetical protein